MTIIKWNQKNFVVDEKIEVLLNQDSRQTQEKLAEILKVTQQAISNSLKAMHMVQKRRNIMNSNQEILNAVLSRAINWSENEIRRDFGIDFWRETRIVSNKIT